MRIKIIPSGLLAATLLLGSCSTPKDITYFQDAYNNTVIDTERQLDIRVMPEDKLSIIVTTQDEELSKLFNLNSGTGSGGGNNRQYYTVDRDGYINFPVIGKLHIAGKNRFEVAEYIQKELQNRDLVKSPIVTVEYQNTAFYALGSVGSPGRIEYNQDQLSIIDAIAMAGDLTINGLRENILVMRDDGLGKKICYRVNLLDVKELAQSPAYYLQQNDIIYVEPNNMTKRNTTPLGNTPFTPAFWISLGSSLLTVTTLIITLSK